MLNNFINLFMRIDLLINNNQMNYSFYLPEKSFSFQKVSSVEDLSRLLKLQEDSNRAKFRISIRKQKYIYCKCTSCSASLTFKKSNQQALFNLTQFQNHHQHRIKLDRVNRMLSSFIIDLPDNIPLKTAKALALNQFPNINPSKFYYFHRKLKNPWLDYRSLINLLDKNQCEIQSRPFQQQMNQLPDLILIVSPAMKSVFNKYGSFASFDLTFHCIKERKHGHIFKLGAFLGLSACRKIVPYGLAIMIDETKQSFYELFKSFGNIMSRHPSYYITDQAAGIKAALKQLQADEDFKGCHILDSFHICRNLKKRLIKKQNLKYFASLLRCRNQFQYERELSQAYHFLEPGQLDILKEFDLESSSTCYSQIPDYGILGFSCSSSVNEKFHDLLKSRIQREQPFTKAVQITLSLMDELLIKAEKFQIEKHPIQQYYFRQIKQVRYNIDKRVFNEFALELPKLLSVQCRYLSTDKAQLQDQNVNCKILLNKVNELWSCQCKYATRAGIPCYHIIKLCLITKSSLLTYFNQRWKIGACLNAEKKKSRSTGKSSRRN